MDRDQKPERQYSNMSGSVRHSEESEEELLRRAVLRLSGNILGLVFGILFALVIFVATNWLVLKGGETVGPHLGLLSQYFIGYSVTFVGSFVGMFYGFVLGYLSGLLIARIYNIVALRSLHFLA